MICATHAIHANSCLNTNGARFLIAKASDVPVYVEYGAADVGIVGQDALRESGVECLRAAGAGYGACRLIVAGKPEYKTAEWKTLVGLRVATKYPRCAQKYFSARGLSAEIIYTLWINRTCADGRAGGFDCRCR